MDFNQLKKQAVSLKEYCLDPSVMAANDFRKNDIEALYEKLIVYLSTMQEISKLPPNSNKNTLIQEQDGQLIDDILEVNEQFAYIMTTDLETLSMIMDWAHTLALDAGPEEDLYYNNKQKHENLNFDQLKKQAEGIRNFFLCPEVMDMNDYQQSDIEALFEKLIAFINSMHEIAELLDSKKDGRILEQVKLLVEYINEFEQQFQAIETEDREHICEIIDGGVILAGYSVRPEDNPEFDITKEWRTW